VLVGQNVDDFLQKPAGDDIVPASSSRDQVVAHLLLLPSVNLRLSALRLLKQTPIRKYSSHSNTRKNYFKIRVLEHVVGAHAVEDELGLVGHAHNVVLHGVRQQPPFVDQLDEGEPSVLLQ
jgi:hypothetical protein